MVVCRYHVPFRRGLVQRREIFLNLSNLLSTSRPSSSQLETLGSSYVPFHTKTLELFALQLVLGYARLFRHSTLTQSSLTFLRSQSDTSQKATGFLQVEHSWVHIVPLHVGGLDRSPDTSAGTVWDFVALGWLSPYAALRTIFKFGWVLMSPGWNNAILSCWAKLNAYLLNRGVHPELFLALASPWRSRPSIHVRLQYSTLFL